MNAYLSLGGGLQIPIEHTSRPPAAPMNGVYSYREVPSTKAAEDARALVDLLVPIIQGALRLPALTVKWFSHTSAEFARSAHLWPGEHVWQDASKAAGWWMGEDPLSVYLDVDRSADELVGTLSHEAKHVAQHRAFAAGHVCDGAQHEQHEREAVDFAEEILRLWNGD